MGPHTVLSVDVKTTFVEVNGRSVQFSIDKLEVFRTA